jgi:hypothetical protein
MDFTVWYAGVCLWFSWCHVWEDAVFGAAGTAVAAAAEETILEEGPVTMTPVQKESQWHLAILHLSTVAVRPSIMHHHHTQR